mmetsp:Transcript_597/g.1414  ORF Transcript_597/g.1414 Transcript_597/m.1414 type:complete len:225 (+) Transcript_597:557-1231(+)
MNDAFPTMRFCGCIVYRWFDVDPLLPLSAKSLQAAHGILPNHRQAAPIGVLRAAKCGLVGNCIIMKDAKEVERLFGILWQKGIFRQVQHVTTNGVCNPRHCLTPGFYGDFVAILLFLIFNLFAIQVGTFGQEDFEAFLGFNGSLARSAFRCNKGNITRFVRCWSLPPATKDSQNFFLGWGRQWGFWNHNGAPSMSSQIFDKGSLVLGIVLKNDGRRLSAGAIVV